MTLATQNLQVFQLMPQAHQMLCPIWRVVRLNNFLQHCPRLVPQVGAQRVFVVSAEHGA